MMTLWVSSFVILMIILAFTYVYRHSLKTIQLVNPDGQVNLKGQFSWNSYYSAGIRISTEGTYVLTVQVLEGKIRLSHNSYNPDGGTWLAPPADGQQAHYDLTPGNHKLNFTNRKHYGQLNQILLVNVRFRGNAVLEYHLEPAVI
ncbi:hypothetical protein ACTP13_18250 [Paenibacillus peoriae]|uniref:hypothetical protein n=1 Tax=Paenibacillus peoriae TaxID=59893 RepID=UPI003F969877